jgi:hypothetical protein
VTARLRTTRTILALTSVVLGCWVAVSVAIDYFRPGGPDTEFGRDLFVRGELELLIIIAATLIAVFALRGAAAALVLLAVGVIQLISGWLSGLPGGSSSAPLLWSGLAAIGAGALGAVESRRALLVIPAGLVLGLGIWIADLASRGP